MRRAEQNDQNMMRLAHRLYRSYNPRGCPLHRIHLSDSDVDAPPTGKILLRGPGEKRIHPVFHPFITWYTNIIHPDPPPSAPGAADGTPPWKIRSPVSFRIRVLSRSPGHSSRASSRRRRQPLCYPLGAQCSTFFSTMSRETTKSRLFSRH